MSLLSFCHHCRMLLQVIQTVLTGCNALKSIECRIERLAVCKAHHITDLFHSQILITLIHKDTHRLINAMTIHKLRYVCHPYGLQLQIYEKISRIKRKRDKFLKNAQKVCLFRKKSYICTVKCMFGYPGRIPRG